MLIWFDMVKPMLVNIKDEKTKDNFKEQCAKNGTSMTKEINDFMTAYTNKNPISLEDFDNSMRLMGTYGEWKKFFELFTTASDMIPYGKKLREIVQLYDNTWDYLESH